VHKYVVFENQIEFIIRLMIQYDLAICPKDYFYSRRHCNNWYTQIHTQYWHKLSYL